MTAMPNLLLAILLGAAASDDLRALLESIQQSEVARVEAELKQAQRAVLQARGQRGSPAAAGTKARQDGLRAELRAIKAGRFSLPKLRPEEFREGRLGILDDPAPTPYTEPRGSRTTRDWQVIANAMRDSEWARMSWNTFRVVRVLSPREFVVGGRQVEFKVRGLDTAVIGQRRTVSIPQIVRVVAAGEDDGERLSTVEVLDPRPAATVLEEWVKKAKKVKVSPR